MESFEKEYGNKATKYMPKTYILSKSEDRIEFYRDYYKKLVNKKSCMVILKNNKQRQQGLKLTDKLKDIQNAEKNGYILAQDYYKDPYIISKRKVNFRYYFLIVCQNGKISGYIYNDGFVYYTPEFYKPNSLNFKRNITTGYIDRKVYETNPLTLKDFRKHLEKKKPGLSKKWDKNVNNLFNKTVQALKSKICVSNKFNNDVLFQIFGADVAPNSKLYPKLMEINKGPDLRAKDGRDKEVKLNMQRDVFKIIDPLPTDSKSDFKKIY